MERALYLAFTLVVVNNVLVSVSPGVQTFQASDVAGRVAIVFGALVMPVAVIVLWARGPSTRTTATVVVAALGCQLVSAASITDPSQLPVNWWGYQLSGALVLYLTGTLTRRPAAILLVAYCATLLLLRQATTTGPGAGLEGVGEVIVVLQLGMLGLFMIPAWRSAAALGDATIRARLAVEEDQARRQAIDRQERAVDRLLHDEVIQTLRLVALPPGARAKSAVVRECRHAVSMLTDPPLPRSQGLGDLAAELRLLRTPLPVSFAGRTSRLVPMAVLRAISGAVSEALRNAQRHAGVEQVEITISETSFGVEVTVRDDGRGFDPSAVNAGRFGLQGSIRQALRDVGADVDIASAPGTGTTLVISWAPPQPVVERPAAWSLVELSKMRSQLLTTALLPQILGSSLLAVFFVQTTAAPLIGSLTAVAAALLSTSSLLWARRFPVTGWMSGGIAVASIGLVAVGGAVLVPDGHAGFDYFATGGVGAALGVLAFFRPTRETVAAVAGVTAVAAVACYRTGPSVTALVAGLGAVMACAIGVFSVLALRLFMDRMHRRIQWDLEAERHDLVSMAATKVLHEVRFRRLARTKDAIGPFLEDVAMGRIDPDDESVRTRAAILEASVRDDLMLGHGINETSRRLIDRLRAEGTDVEIIGAPEAETPARAALAELLTSCLEGTSPARVVVSLSAGALGNVAVTVLISPPPTSQHRVDDVARRLGGNIRRTDQFLLLTAAVPADARSLADEERQTHRAEPVPHIGDYPFAPPDAEIEAWRQPADRAARGVPR